MRVILLPLLCLSWLPAADAQQRRLPGYGTSPIEVGSELADVTGFTGEGEPFPLRDKLKGRYAVLTFGCLT